jgi:HSP20 family protein
LAETNAPVKKEASEVAGPEPTRGGIHYTPRVDICESPDELLLFCDMPGVRAEDLDVHFEKNELTLHGKVRRRQSAGVCLREEYGVGDFYRSFRIAPEIDATKIAAEYRDGVLTVHLPKPEKAKPKRVAVKCD